MPRRNAMPNVEDLRELQTSQRVTVTKIEDALTNPVLSAEFKEDVLRMVYKLSENAFLLGRQQMTRKDV